MSALSWSLPVGFTLPWFPFELHSEKRTGRAPLGINQVFAGHSQCEDTFKADTHHDASHVSVRGIKAALQTGLLQRKERSAREGNSIDNVQPQAEPAPGPEPYVAAPDDTISEEEEALVKMYVERQKSTAKILKMLYDMQTDIYDMIGDAAARRFKVMEDLAEKWAKAMRGD
ncbi:MAG: hypothetical protein AB2L14_10860 [Candidatus Xenobiia bacterium LiM19]